LNLTTKAFVCRICWLGEGGRQEEINKLLTQNIIKMQLKLPYAKRPAFFVIFARIFLFGIFAESKSLIALLDKHWPGLSSEIIC
jgi:hypothetical protein